ncbi:succinate dehydrogenase assembly factor 2 [Bartonella tamiae]|uniref:FAD assembly factor SdhE n=1 Tax=Bartonella tamiae Th239 TaxID=1094558 RepID=J0ZK62_9HYPH|nr:succinate dehydrogenase assembly factor 2 [Bartonella tamiae]EJF88728.1 hypothetical protein ME5_01279 [Bartonella tamiae Th239]EJF95022.1 hypothetical protein MEG_00603 [Bartonella tamiae Th307]
MTDFISENDPLDKQRRRLVFRAWHRGIKEMDLILGQYVDKYVHQMNEETIKEMEFIMSFEDRDLLTWVTGEVASPETINTPLFQDIIDYRFRMDFTN